MLLKPEMDDFERKEKNCTPRFFNVKHILYKIVTCTAHIKMYNLRLSKVLQGFLMQ